MADRIELPDRIKDLLSGAARKFGIEDAAAVSRIWGRWNEVVGPEISAHAQPVSLKGGVLRVQAESPVWATEIGYLADEIRARINGSVGSTVVHSVTVFTARSGAMSNDRRRRDPAAGNRSERASETSPGGASKDPFEAFERARRAWAARRR